MLLRFCERCSISFLSLFQYFSVCSSLKHLPNIKYLIIESIYQSSSSLYQKAINWMVNCSNKLCGTLSDLLSVKIQIHTHTQTHTQISQIKIVTFTLDLPNLKFVAVRSDFIFRIIIACEALSSLEARRIFPWLSFATDLYRICHRCKFNYQKITELKDKTDCVLPEADLYTDDIIHEAIQKQC